MSPDQARTTRADLEPTPADITTAIGRINGVTVGSLHARAGGVLSGLLSGLRMALVQDDHAAVTRVVREMTAVDMAADQLAARRALAARAELSATGGAR